MILTLVSWIKQLWIIGVEYGVELEAVHDGLMCCQLTLREVSESPGEWVLPSRLQVPQD